MATTDDITVRQCKPGEENYLMEFAKAQSWDYSMYDYRCYMRFAPDFLLVAIDKTGTPVGFGGLSLHAPNLYYLGNFIVRDDLRNKGIGRKLWQAMIAKAGDNNIALDGAPAMVNWYKKNGFQFQSFKVWFHNITVTDEMKLTHTFKYDIQRLSEGHWPALMEYDRLVYPNFNRERILRAWFADELVEVFLVMKGESVLGYGSIHKQSDNVYAVRNVYADNEDVLEEILRKMFDKLPTGTVARFMLIDGKPMPQYLKSADESADSAQRLFNKQMIETNVERMWLGTAHII
ncbi:hypothetical protein ACF0H5_010082 [Mactra antiquata]